MHLGGNIALNRSKVLDLGGDKEFFVNGVNTSLPTFLPGGIVRVGEPLGNFFGYIWDGIFQTAAEATASGQSGAVAGGMKLRDVNKRRKDHDGRSRHPRQRVSRSTPSARTAASAIARSRSRTCCAACKGRRSST